ncbi:MAG: FecR domain-containing protein [Pigmentiphaga sp.]|uniref:FecR domain-containing protein n=1 Tax=Pigmentiphaga sp. TaxID=1977564 RepID=UPI0029B0CA2C|nr:FecR domain-containing protein [Pigmentiphaga sp.]MDX3906713.1 FecR domain-containing protein [Pigmentiphaga sp.]
MAGRSLQVPVSDDVLDMAIDWQLRMGSGDATDSDRAALKQWLAEHPNHRRAWQQLGELEAGLEAVRGRAVRQVLARPRGRRVLKKAGPLLGVLLLAAAVLALADRELPLADLGADYRTAVGQRQHVVLSDGTKLDLNTRTAVDVRFDAEQRLVVLRRGEIHVRTGHSPGERRPLVVRTDDGALLPEGTRFTVRRDDGVTRLAVYESAVQARPRVCGTALAACAVARRVREGEQAVMRPQEVTAPTAADAHADAWRDGMLVVHDRPLAQVVRELARYRFGPMTVQPDAAGLRLTGTVPLDDIDRSLAMLTRGLPVRIRSYAGVWLDVLHSREEAAD